MTELSRQKGAVFFLKQCRTSMDVNHCWGETWHSTFMHISVFYSEDYDEDAFDETSAPVSIFSMTKL